jgi:hypothetical protein
MRPTFRPLRAFVASIVISAFGLNGYPQSAFILSFISQREDGNGHRKFTMKTAG